MRLPLYIVVAQWTMLLVLGFLVFVVYRQLGLVMSGQKERPEVGPELQSIAARFEYLRFRDETIQSVEPGDGVPKLIAFVDPTCASCEMLVGNLGAARSSGRLRDVDVVLLVSDPPKFVDISEPFRTTTFDIGQIVTDSALNDYRARATPLLVAVDRAGVVRATGAAVEEAEIEGFIRALHAPAAQRIPVHAQPVVPPDPTDALT